MEQKIEALNKNTYLIFTALVVSIVANVYLIANAHRHWNDIEVNKNINIVIKKEQICR